MGLLQKQNKANITAIRFDAIFETLKQIHKISLVTGWDNYCAARDFILTTHKKKLARISYKRDYIHIRKIPGGAIQVWIICGSRNATSDYMYILNKDNEWALSWGRPPSISDKAGDVAVEINTEETNILLEMGGADKE